MALRRRAVGRHADAEEPDADAADRGFDRGQDGRAVLGSERVRPIACRAGYAWVTPARAAGRRTPARNAIVALRMFFIMAWPPLELVGSSFWVATVAPSSRRPQPRPAARRGS